MRQATKASAKRLRFLAYLSFLVGLIIGLLVIFFALYNVYAYQQKYATIYSDVDIWTSIKSASFRSALIGGGLSIFSGYVGYIFFEAYATTLENLDKTPVVEAIYTLTTSITGNNPSGNNDSALKLLREYIDNQTQEDEEDD